MSTESHWGRNQTHTRASTISRKNFKSISTFIGEPDSRAQCAALEDNVKEFGLTYFGMDDKRQGGYFWFHPLSASPLLTRLGIVHIIGPEQGFTLPGTTVVCGDSHTSSESSHSARLGISSNIVQLTVRSAPLLSVSAHPRSST